MDRFTIKDIEQLTGIKAHTLRVWEQRYDLLTPTRAGREHRIYTAEELRRALRIAQLYHTGIRISLLAAMSPAEMDARLDELDEKEAEISAVRRFIETTLSFDEISFRQGLDRAVSSLGVTKAILMVIYPFLKRIGQLWMNNHVQPGQEHFASLLIRNRIIVEIDRLASTNTPQAKGSVLFFAPEGEQHEIPLLFAQYLFRKNGWKTIALGTDRTIEEVVDVARQGNYAYLFLHPLTNLTQKTMTEYLVELLHALPNQQIIFSGPLAIQVEPNIPGILLLGGEQDLLKFTGEQP